MEMYQRFLIYGRRVFLTAEGLADRAFTPRYNPFYYLGAIAIFFLWWIFISGIYLFIFYKIATPYESVKYITEGQWRIGAIMRSIHRYASAGLVLTSILHLLHVYFMDRFRHWRWVAWVSGVGLLAAIWVTGIIGYWMVWDEKAQMIAQLTTEFLDRLPVFGGILSLSFTKEQLVTNLFFFMILFLHIFIPIFLFILLWVHVMRISKPVINPPKKLGMAIGGVLLILSIIKPVAILLPADTKKIVSMTGVDWFYLWFFPLVNGIPAWTSYLALGMGLAVLMAFPWLGRSERPEAAEIFTEKCTGCSLCFKDCPYDAIHMRPRSDGRPYDLEAVVLPARCAGCGICVGSCSFDGVFLPGWAVGDVKDEIKRLIEEIKGGERPAILGLVCSSSLGGKEFNSVPFQSGRTDLKSISSLLPRDIENVRFITLPCVGMIHPSWIEQALELGAEGVFICGCQMGDCQYRFGNQWIKDRISASRAPILKGTVDRSRIRTWWSASMSMDRVLKEIRKFEEDLRHSKVAGIRRDRPKGLSMQEAEKPATRYLLPAAYTVLASVFLIIPAVLIFYLTDAPYTFSAADESRLILGVRHTAQRIEECDEAEMFRREAARYRESLRKTKRAKMELGKLGECSRERHPVYVELYIDNEKMLGKSYKPGGIKRDGPSFAYEKFPVRPGVRKVLVRMRDSADGGRFDYSLEEDVEFKAGHIRMIDFDEVKKGLRIS